MIDELARPRFLIERMPLGYIALDAEYRVLDWNGVATTIFGYTKEEALGQWCPGLILPRPLPDQLRALFQRIESGDMDAHNVNENHTKDGRTITCEWFNTPFLDAGGRFMGSVSLVQDITERRRAEEQMRLDELILQRLAANIDGYFWLNASDDSRMYYMSPGWEKITGRSIANLYANPESWIDVIHPEDRAGALAVVMAPIGAEGRQVEYRAVRPDGAVRWIHDRSFPVYNDAGEIYRVAGIGEDVTDRKEAMRQLHEHAERVQALSRRLIAVREDERRRIARELHDKISQTLTSLAISLDLAAAASSPEVCSQRVADARASLDKGLRQVRNLSAELRPTALDPLGLLAAVLWFFEHFKAQTAVEVCFRHDGLDGRFGPNTETVAFRLVEEALHNVARHAQARDVSVRIWAKDGLLNVQIEDEGVGFDWATVRKSAKSSGLAVIDEQVLLLGGRLVIDTAPGEGTHVFATLPIGP